MTAYWRHSFGCRLKFPPSITSRTRFTYLYSSILVSYLRPKHTTHITAAKFIELVNHKTKLESKLRKASLHAQQHQQQKKPGQTSTETSTKQITDAIGNQTESKDRFGTLGTNKAPMHESLASRVHTPKSESILDKILKDDWEPDPGDQLRLSKVDRRHPPNYYLNEIIKFCNKGNTKSALSVLFDSMLTTDRVMPSRFHIHALLDGLAKVGDSENAFRVYAKMTELGIAPTQATYSRLFRACAEDIACWYRTNRYLLPPAIGYTENLPLVKRKYLSLQTALAPDIPLSSFGGPAVDRVNGLWSKLNQKNINLTKVTYNALILALAKAGDLQGCLRVLDTMLVNKKLTPDNYTLTALLSAIEPATIRRRLSLVGTSHSLISSDHPSSVFEFILNLWHKLMPFVNYLPSSHHFTLLSRIMHLWDDFPGSKSNLPLTIQINSEPTSLHLLANDSNRLLNSESKQTRASILASCEAAERLLHEAARSADLFRASRQSIGFVQLTNDVLSTSSSLTSQSSVTSVYQENSALDGSVWSEWDDSTLALKSPINLLLPFEGKFVIKPPPNGIWLPWHRLALVGGLHGFFDAMENHYKVKPNLLVMNNLIPVLPTPSSDDPLTDCLDFWETELFRLIAERDLKPDLAIYNALINRRVRSGKTASFLLSELVRNGFVPDQITWGTLACACTNLKAVKKLYNAYCEASRSVNPRDSVRSGIVRPNLTFYASMLSGSCFNWDVKLFVLKMMLGPQFDWKPNSSPNKLDSKRKHFQTTVLTEETKPNQNQDNEDDEDDLSLQFNQDQFEGVAPSRRLIASIDADVALFRRLVAQGVVPSDGSPVPASKTGGIAVPPYALKSFHRFIRVYKIWLHQSPVEDSSD